jgi:hypothetical protein
MARKPNYRFDRMERDRAKAAKRAERQKSREERTATARDMPEAEGAAPPLGDAEDPNQGGSQTA